MLMRFQGPFHTQYSHKRDRPPECLERKTVRATEEMGGSFRGFSRELTRSEALLMLDTLAAGP